MGRNASCGLFVISSDDEHDHRKEVDERGASYSSPLQSNTRFSSCVKQLHDKERELVLVSKHFSQIKRKEQHERK